MSNPGMIVLAKTPLATKNLRHFVVEDNIGEAIHLHWNNLRIDLTISQFLCFAEQLSQVLKNLSRHGYPDITLLDPWILGAIAPLLGAITSIEKQTKHWHDLRLVDDTYPASKSGKQVVVFGDEPYIRFGGDQARKLRSISACAEIEVITIHFAGEQWRLDQDITQPVQVSAQKKLDLVLPQRTVMMLAGTSGSGKSTVLRESLLKREPLFGEANNEAFQMTQLPPKFPEDRVSLQKRLDRGTWLHEIDLIKLHKSRARPSVLVIHFDLFFWLWIMHIQRTSIPPSQAEASFQELLLSPHRMKQLFRMAFKLFPLQGAQCVIKTLKPDFDIIAARWIAREENLNREADSFSIKFLKHSIYGGQAIGRNRHENIYKAWDLAINH